MRVRTDRQELSRPCDAQTLIEMVHVKLGQVSDLPWLATREFAHSAGHWRSISGRLGGKFGPAAPANGCLAIGVSPGA
jgi:hypothetical protein